MGVQLGLIIKQLLFLVPSRSGKTTLIMELLEYGHRLISDDLLVIDNETGEILPFKKPIVPKKYNKRVL